MIITGFEKTINNNNEKIGSLNTQVSKLDQNRLEKRKQLTVFEVDINALDYGLYKPTFEFANSDLYKEE